MDAFHTYFPNGECALQARDNINDYYNCPHSEISDDGPHMSFSLGTEIYIVGGVTAQVTINTEQIGEDLYEIWRPK